MKKSKNQMSRRLLTVTMSSVLMLSLASCSNSDNHAKFNENETYATSGSYTVTTGELWNELKWSASDILESQIENVVLNSQINKITKVMKNDYSKLSAEEKELFADENEYKQLYEEYNSRLIDYVVQDIYNLEYKNEAFWESVDKLTTKTKTVSEAKYIDELLTNYRLEYIGNEKVEDLVKNGNKDNTAGYLKLALNLTDLYYPSLAKELYAQEKINEEIKKADDEDDDSEDDKIGYFSNSEFVSKFKTLYANKGDLDLVLIRFSSEDEFNKTLRAFGLKVYNKEIYLVDAEDKSYEEYCDYYDDLSNSELTKMTKLSNNPDCILEMYVAIYNYCYDGYRSPIKTVDGIPQINNIDDLRKVSKYIFTNVTDSAETIENIKSSNVEYTYTKDELDEISSSFTTYLYETLTDDIPYSTSSQSYNSSYYIAYKFGTTVDEDNNIYNKDMTTDDIIDFLLKEDNKKYFDEVHKALSKDKVTESSLTSYLNEAIKDVEVKIYNEAIEISYLKNHLDYSKTLGKNKNKNVLATIKYEDKTYNFNLTKDVNDENSLIIAGTDTPFGAYEYLEVANGQTTSIDLLSNKIIKDTESYEKTSEYKDNYVNYIEAILYNFSNNGYSSNGYSSSLGKYNFLMLYFHSADIDEIVDNYYRVQYASVSLLSNYSDDKLLSFFKNYVDASYDNYFKLGGKRFVVYFDGDDDGEADDTDINDSSNWINLIANNGAGFDINNDGAITGSETTITYGEAAKALIYDVYDEINASTTNHTSKADELVSEINGTAKVIFDNNPIVSENQWAKYRKIGLRVKVEEFTVDNSTVDVDFNLKQRLYEYTDESKYQFFINGTTPSCFIENLTKADDELVLTDDGYNLIMVTSGSPKSSAEWKESDHSDDLLKNITIKYNEEYIKVEDIYNDEDKLSLNQIKLYVLEYVTSSSSNLTPSQLSEACSNFLSPVLTRYTSSATQRVIILEYIKNASGAISFADNQEYFNKIQVVNQRIADEYSEYNNDTTGTSNNFENWWTDLEVLLKEAK